MVITAEQLQAIVGKINDKKRLDSVVSSLNETFIEFQINTPLRAAHFLAQIIHESGAFRYMEEIWGPTGAQKDYEGKKSLGNIQLGDGYKFRGRGWIQLTGRANYDSASKYFGRDFINNPDIAAQYPYVALVAGWYWYTRDLNAGADADDLEGVTKRINGGLNGYADRKIWLTKVKSVILK